MATVDLVYDQGCPHVGLARANLVRAFSRCGLSARWQEHQVGDPQAPARVRGFGSPTILVDGKDVAQSERGSEACCRIYSGAGGTAGAPPVEMIITALRPPSHPSAAPSHPSFAPRRMRSIGAILPAIGVALMPKVVCPLCWPAYAGVLSAAGLTFLMEDRWLVPISIAILMVALTALTWRAERRRGYTPALAGFGASLAILAGKFVLDSDVSVYAGIAALIAASIWNAWPRRVARAPCSACIPQLDQRIDLGAKS